MEKDKESKIFLQPFQDRNLKFPQRPCLISDLKFFLMPDGLGVQVRGAESIVVLRGQLCDSVIPWLLSVLDGSLSIEEIFAKCPTEVKPQQLSRALVVMFNRGLFAEAPPPGNVIASDAVTQKQLLFFGRKLGVTRANATGQTVQDKLASAQVILVGDGLFGSATFDILTRSGCNNVKSIDWSDEGLMSESVQQVLLSAGIAGQSPPVVSHSAERLLSMLENMLPAADLLITATNCGSNRLFSEINRLCLLHVVPWLRGNDDGVNVEIGPFVNPFNSACYRCLILRRNSAAEYAIEEELFDRTLADSAGEFVHRGEFLAGATACAGILAAEAIRILTRLTKPSSENSVLRVSVDGAIERDSFVRVARCPDCYRGEIKTTLEPVAKNSHA